MIQLRVSTSVLKTIDKHGGLDNYLVNTADVKIDSELGVRLKRMVRQKFERKDFVISPAGDRAEEEDRSWGGASPATHELRRVHRDAESEESSTMSGVETLPAFILCNEGKCLHTREMFAQQSVRCSLVTDFLSLLTSHVITNVTFLFPI
eukprot:761961-Hanusia_phi.AAC.11